MTQRLGQKVGQMTYNLGQNEPFILKEGTSELKRMATV